MNNETLQIILEYIDLHIYEKISLCELSELVGYSPFYFSKLFSEAMGMPVTAYVSIRKIQHSIIQLLEGQKILDIALLYAFDSHEGYTRSFTRFCGSTPSTFRKCFNVYTVPKYGFTKNIKGSNNMKTDLQYDMHQLVFEFLEQSIEEAKEGFCTKLDVSFLTDGSVKINDNGRGIPLCEDLIASKEVLEKILAGKPITNAEYSQMGDLKSAGLQTVNSLCESLCITVNCGERSFTQNYIRGVVQHELQTIILDINASGMEVIMKPDTEIFKDSIFSHEIITDWLKDKTIDIPDLEVQISI